MSRAEIIRLDNDEPSVNTVVLCLNEVLSDIEHGKINPKKCIIALIDDESEIVLDGLPVATYDLKIRTGGISAVEGISVLEMCKTRFLQWIGVLPIALENDFGSE